MRSLSVLSELPRGYTVEADDRSVVAVWQDARVALGEAGFGLRSVGEVGDSDLAAGRRRMEQLSTSSGRFVVRRFVHGGLARALTGRRYLDPERPFRELIVSDQLIRGEIRTPRVVAARATRAGSFGYHLDLLTRRVEGTMTFAQFLDTAARGGVQPSVQAAVLEACGALVRQLHDRGLVHVDLNANNILVSRDALLGEAPETWIIDLDQAYFDHALSDDLRQNGLRRLYRHVVRLGRERPGAVSLARCARFMRGYDPERKRWRNDWRAIAERHRRSFALHGLGWMLERCLGGRRTVLERAESPGAVRDSRADS